MTEPLQSALAEAGRLLSEGRRDDAERAYQAILERTPGVPAAQAQLGVLALQRGDAGRAEPLLAAAARSLPRVAALHLNLGTARRRLERHAEALAPLRRAILLNPGTDAPYAALGQSASRAGDRVLAASALRAAVAPAPRDPDLWYNLGVALVEAGRLAEAAAAYRRNGRLLRGRPANQAAASSMPS